MGGKKAFAVDLKSVIEAIDRDGEGQLDAEEKKLVQTLKSMDKDSDGKIDIMDIVKIAETRVQNTNKIKNLKKLIVVLIIAFLVTLGAILGIVIAANEATKDTKPKGEGVIKATNGDPVGMGGATTSVPLKELYTQPASVLRKIKELVVSSEFGYEIFTITHVQSTAPGTSVTFETANDKTVTITKDAVEVYAKSLSLSDMPADFPVDESAFTDVPTRKLLGIQEPGAVTRVTRHLLSDTNVDGGAAVKDEVGSNSADTATDAAAATVAPDPISVQIGQLCSAQGLEPIAADYTGATAFPWDITTAINECAAMSSKRPGHTFMTVMGDPNAASGCIAYPMGPGNTMVLFNYMWNPTQVGYPIMGQFCYKKDDFSWRTFS